MHLRLNLCQRPLINHFMKVFTSGLVLVWFCFDALLTVLFLFWTAKREIYDFWFSFEKKKVVLKPCLVGIESQQFQSSSYKGNYFLFCF